MSFSRSPAPPRSRAPTWLFDLDDTLHDASQTVFERLNRSMTEFVQRELTLSWDQANALRHDYWRRYGATLLGLERHHGVRAAHFLHETHRLPGLEKQLRIAAADRAALGRLPGRKFVLTNAPADYAQRVLTTLGLTPYFEGVVSIEGMRVFGQLRPKPDARMLRIVLARLGLEPARTVLVEDTLGHLRSARRLGMKTVWMQRYVKVMTPKRFQGGDEHACQRAIEDRANRRAITHRPEVGIHLYRRPTYVCARISCLRQLQPWTSTLPVPK